MDGIFEVCGVAEDMFRWQFSLKCKSNQKNATDLDFDIFRSICSAVDKLDKAPWEEVTHKQKQDMTKLYEDENARWVCCVDP